MGVIYRIHIPLRTDEVKAKGILPLYNKTSVLLKNNAFTVTENQLKALCEAGIAFDFLKEKDETVSN